MLAKLKKIEIQKFSRESNGNSWIEKFNNQN